MKLKTIVCCLLSVILVLAVVTTTDAKNKKTDYTKHAGYVDFEAMEFFGADYAKIEVNLSENMIKLVAKFLQGFDLGNRGKFICIDNGLGHNELDFFGQKWACRPAGTHVCNRSFFS